MLASAVLGSADKARFVSFNDDESAAGLRAGKVDVLALSTPTIAGAAAGFGCGPIIFYDAEGFLVPRRSNISKVPSSPVRKSASWDRTLPRKI